VRTILAGICVTLALAVVAAFALSEAQKDSFQVYATQSVRVGDPGHNLVGPKWNGENYAPDRDL
jgi:hypothetical protein